MDLINGTITDAIVSELNLKRGVVLPSEAREWLEDRLWKLACDCRAQGQDSAYGFGKASDVDRARVPASSM